MTEQDIVAAGYKKSYTDGWKTSYCNKKGDIEINVCDPGFYGYENQKVFYGYVFVGDDVRIEVMQWQGNMKDLEDKLIGLRDKLKEKNE